MIYVNEFDKLLLLFLDINNFSNVCFLNLKNKIFFIVFKFEYDNSIVVIFFYLNSVCNMVKLVCIKCEFSIL